MSDKKLSDAEIWKIVEQFEKSKGDKKNDSYIGSGNAYDAYHTENPDYILKEIANTERTAVGAGKRKNPTYGNDKLIEKYINTKQLNKISPDSAEQPLLIARPDKPSYLLQKKLAATANVPGIKEAAIELEDKLTSQGILNGSRSKNTINKIANTGMDEAGLAKILSVPRDFSLADLADNDILKKIRETAKDKITKSSMPHIYRSLLPLATGAAGLAYSAASEASDTEDMGGASEQAALLRDIDANKQMNTIQNSTSVPEDVRLQALELFKRNKLPF